MHIHPQNEVNYCGKYMRIYGGRLMRVSIHKRVAWAGLIHQGLMTQYVLYVAKATTQCNITYFHHFATSYGHLSTKNLLI